MKVTETEPLALKAVVERLAQTAVAGLIVFNVWHPNADQTAWLIAAMALVGGLLDSLVRLKVWSPASHARAVAEAEGKVPEAVVAQLAAAEGRASVADQIVAKLGPPPGDVKLGGTPERLEAMLSRAQPPTR